MANKSGKGKKKFSVWRALLSVLGVAFLGAGIFLLVAIFTAPDLAEKVVYSTKTNVEAKIEKAKESIVDDYYPTICFYGSGGMYELDLGMYNCFVHVLAYDSVEGVPKTWAAHNGLGGDPILTWEVGQKVRIENDGYDGVWVVVDYKDIDKFGPVSQAEGLLGDIALQTCHWGEPIVRFVGLVPLETYENDWPPKPQSGEEKQQSAEAKDDVMLVVED